MASAPYGPLHNIKYRATGSGRDVFISRDPSVQYGGYNPQSDFGRSGPVRLQRAVAPKPTTCTVRTVADSEEGKNDIYTTTARDIGKYATVLEASIALVVPPPLIDATFAQELPARTFKTTNATFMKVPGLQAALVPHIKDYGGHVPHFL
mmetsp:Transcript_15925/g.26268  ORF Transcript_15925/g.26268 Transcript_15925/m.26268 type:complete len:150 (+) Transcript_15925:156-605(+)|eukprot:CAMPEP_0184667794 /NCGR_PEP_ID=MMETSP0308-20130426/69200_1 /TAXON_ID=38269 /ORGANISM="Gloeochaete witrockiana, Strain SAG 46.84" /LENGTH=149 /DNA_ID=CAMNT_0027113187 /DNA_START=76 /DNA_END=525 /DNA_ORIENTATION=-